jgi:hypothetical protein
VTETDHPSIVFSQDGGAVKTRMWYEQGTNGFWMVQEFNDHMIFWTNNTEKMRIQNSGNVWIWTFSPTQKLHVAGNVLATAYLYSSDETLKKEISTLSNPLGTIEKLRWVDFTWKETGKKDVWFIAQELEEVLPELVSTSEETGLKSVQYGNIVAVVVEAVKDIIKNIKAIHETNNAQQNEIDAQQNQIETLKWELEELKKILNK